MLLISQGQPLLAQELFPFRADFLLRSRLFAYLLTGNLYTQFGMASKAVRVCLRHKRILNERCPSLQCQKPIPILHSRTRLGYCPYCDYWLGNVVDADATPPETISNEELEQAVWDATVVGELLEVAPCLSSPLQKEDLVLAINSLISRMPVKKAVSLTRLLNRKSVEEVVLWQKGLEIPRMSTLLQICHLQDVSLRQIFFREVDGVFLTISEEHKKLNRELDIEPKKIYPDFEETQKALEAILATDEEPFPSIREVAHRLGYRGMGPLYSRFPELSRSIAAKYRKHNPRQREPMSLEKLRQALEAVLASDEEPPLSIQEVACSLGYRSETSLYGRFPELSHKIVAKYRAYHSNYKQRVSSSELKEALEAVLASSEVPFPSIQEVARRLGYRHPTFLYKHFPELSRAISMKKRNREDLQQKLEMFLKDADPAITHQEIAKHFGWSINRLRHHFPELRSILERRLIQSFDIEALQAALEKELTSDSAPQSLSAMARGLGYPVRTLMRFFPEICQKIIVRGQVYRKAHSDLRKQRVQDEVQRAVLTIHGEQRYPSLNQVLRLIDLSCVNPPIFHLEAYIPWKKILEDLGYNK